MQTLVIKSTVSFISSHAEWLLLKMFKIKSKNKCMNEYVCVGGRRPKIIRLYQVPTILVRQSVSPSVVWFPSSDRWLVGCVHSI